MTKAITTITTFRFCLTNQNLQDNPGQDRFSERLTD